MNFALRLARLDEQAELAQLIARSARALSRADYSAAQVEGALRGAFGVDSQLIRDGTYWVACDADGTTLGCGGWSRRQTLFGGDQGAVRDARLLDPHSDAARIRAFFVAPEAARRGIGRELLGRCEAAAIEHGFTRFALMATLTGVRLYEKFGYVAADPRDYELEPGLTITFVPMEKDAPGAPRA
jgi:GNAT superfamily N-acetyltransferase